MRWLLFPFVLFGMIIAAVGEAVSIGMAFVHWKIQGLSAREAWSHAQWWN